MMLNVRRADLHDHSRPAAGTAAPDHLGAERRPVGGGEHDHRRERRCATLIPKLKAAGAQGIVEYPLNKIVL